MVSVKSLLIHLMIILDEHLMEIGKKIMQKEYIIYATLFLISYLIGSIPWAFILGKLKGIDIRKHGSGNVGATNARRVLGKKIGILCFFLDFLKGFLPLKSFLILCEKNILDISSDYAFIIVAFSVIAGHIWPIYLKFKGGKGVSTMAGILLATAPISLLIGGIIWTIIFYTFRYVSLASILAAITLPISAFILSKYEIDKLSNTMLTVLLALALLIIIKHKSNIARLIKGTENRFKKNKGSDNENSSIR